MVCRTSVKHILSVSLVIMMLLIPMVMSAQDAAKVVEVVIAGNVNINIETISNVTTLKSGDEYTEQAAEKDRVSIMSLGNFSAVSKRTEEVPGGVKVIYEVTENPRIIDIKVVGSEPMAPEKILELIKTKSGQVLNTASLDQDLESIMALYRDAGYIAYPTEDTGIDPQTGVLTIAILVHTVESVEISGNKKTKSYVFLREMKTKPGAYFNVKVLKDDIMKIYNLDILEEIKQYQITPGADLGTVKVVIPVVEKKTGQVSVGFGYSSKQRLVGQARLSETNFRGKGQGMNVLFEQGTTQAVGGPSSYELSYLEPWLDKNHTSLSVSAFSKVLYRFSSGVFSSGNIDGEPYNERHKGGDLTLSRPLNDTTRIYLGGKFENVETDPALLDPVNDLSSIVQDGDVTSGSLRMVHNTRDFDLDPAVGGYEAYAAEFGSVSAVTFRPDATQRTGFSQLPFDGTYTKGSFDVRRYFSRGGRKTTPQDKRITLALRLRAGLGGGTIPFFEQFFVGGAESLRGYKEDRFWGDKMLLLSAELRKPIAQAITGVLFADYGGAWGGDPNFVISDFSQSQSFEGNLGVGVGMRVTTPIGHLRLDYGVGNEGSRTHFSMGHAF